VRKDKSDAKPKLFTKFIVATIAVIFVARVSRTMFTPFVALFVQERLGTIVGAATYTGAINSATGIATAVAAVTLTRLGDKYNKLKLVFLMTGASLVAGALLIPGYPIAIFVGVYAIYFFIAGAIEPILTSAASEETDPAIRGSLFGILGTVNSLAMMVSPMIGAGISTKFSVNAILVLIPIGAVLQLIVLYCNKKNFKHTIIPENIKKTPLNDMFEN
ncbi:MAG: MFS transporter, partial [Anaerovorax sp.]